MPRGNLYRLAWILYLVLAVGGAVWIGLARDDIPLALFVDRETWWLDLLLGLAAGLGLLGLWGLSRRRLAGAVRLEEALREHLGTLDRGEVLALAALSGFAEELFFRGAVQGAWGLVPATLIFALLHTGPGPDFRLWTLFAAVAGLTLGALMAWRGNLLAPVTAHFLVNAVNLHRLTQQQGEPLPADGDSSP